MDGYNSPTLARALIELLDECDRRLNDPKGDGSGDGAVAPSADHYNGLQDLVRELVGGWSGPETGDGANLRRLLALHPDLEHRIIDAGYSHGLSDELRIALRDFLPKATEVA